jgi:hypothetical protein
MEFQRVQIYSNLHKKLWSVRDKKTRKVIAHKATVILSHCEFKVSEAGRQRVLKEKRKNVHAIVEGWLRDDLCDFNMMDYISYANSQVIYNPYKYDSFMLNITGAPIYHCLLALFTDERKVLVRF